MSHTTDGHLVTAVAHLNNAAVVVAIAVAAMEPREDFIQSQALIGRETFIHTTWTPVSLKMAVRPLRKGAMPWTADRDFFRQVHVLDLRIVVPISVSLPKFRQDFTPRLGPGSSHPDVAAIWTSGSVQVHFRGLIEPSVLRTANVHMGLCIDVLNLGIFKLLAVSSTGLRDELVRRPCARVRSRHLFPPVSKIRACDAEQRV